MKKVLFIVPYPKDCAPSQRLKFEQYFYYFQKAGIKCVERPFMNKAFYSIIFKKGRYARKVLFTIFGYLKRACHICEALNYDAVYLHLEAAPFGPAFFERLLRFFRKPIIYDIDDVIFIPSHSTENRFLKYLDNPNKIFEIFKISSHIIVVTEYLKQCALKYNRNITVIPPTIDTDKYYGKSTYDNKKRVCVGWSGSKTTSTYLHLLDNVLKKISGKYDVKIKVIGNSDFRIDGLDNLFAYEWKLDSEVQDLQEIDIGLYPLPDNEWILGKGGLKALQYMGLGIPVICSKRGACLDFIRDGENGMFADTEEEWVQKIGQLILDVSLRERIGSAGRKTVEESFSLKANAAKYLEVINSVWNLRDR